MHPKPKCIFGVGVACMALDTSITKSTIYSSAHNLIFKTLDDNLTNPHTTGKWIYSSFPYDKISNDDYPLIVIPSVSVDQEYLTAGETRKVLVPMSINIEVWAVSGTQLDSVCDDVIDTLDTTQDTLKSNGLEITGFSPTRIDTRWIKDSFRLHINTIVVEAQYDYSSSGT